MIIGYARVSTKDQTDSLRTQTETLTVAGAERVFTDVASGAKASRPGLRAAIDYARDADTILVTRMDRLGRTVLDTMSTLRDLDSRGIRVQAQDINLDTNTPSGKLLLSFILAMAEWERETILSRTREGLDAARSQGRVGGRKPSLDAGQQATARAALEAGMPPSEVARLFDVSRWTIYRLRDSTQ